MKFKTQYNATPDKGEKNTLPSETVPDQSMTVREIMERYARGLPLGGEKFPVYHGENTPPDLKRMDLTDIEEMTRKNAQFIADARKEFSKPPTVEVIPPSPDPDKGQGSTNNP